MSKNKKYSCRVEASNGAWTAEIVRKVSVKNTVVSKSQGGFSSEAEAQSWGEVELKSFLMGQSERNKRRAQSRD
jgi:hypothetical protein